MLRCAVTDERRFDDHEVGLILKRVTELHEREGEKADARAMTKVEIEQVVAELGISKALVARAVSEISVQDVRNRPSWWFGGKTDVMLEQVIDGRVDEATLTQMLEVLRRYLGDPGELKVEGGARIWSTTSNTTRRINFSVVEHAGNTTLRLEESMQNDASARVAGPASAGGFIGVMAMVPLKAVLIKSVLLLAMGPLVAAGATVGWLGGRALWKRHSAKREGDLGRAFAEVLALAGAGQRQLPEASDID